MTLIGSSVLHRTSSRLLRCEGVLLICGVLAFMLGFAPAFSVHAQSPSPAPLPADVRQAAFDDVLGTMGTADAGPLRRIGVTLARVHRAYDRHRALGKSARPFRPPSPSLHVGDGAIAIDAIAREEAGALLRDLQALGLRKGAIAGKVVSGRLPISALPDAARLPTLHTARPVLVRTARGLVTTQGLEAMQTDVFATDQGVDGTGVRIGVLSDSYDNYDTSRFGTPATTAVTDVGNGDLPGRANPNGFTIPVDVLEESEMPERDEGRAMAQIIHDIAPGAELVFHTAFNGLANFATGIRELADDGATIITDDVLFLAEPMFQDGIIAQAIDDVVFGQDVFYVTAAGNSARQSYEADANFGGDGGPVAGGALHDFDPSPTGTDRFQAFTIPVGTTVEIAFQWDQPSASVGGRGARSNLEFILMDDAGTVLEAEGRPNIGGNPFEFVSFTNSGNIDADRDGTPDTRFQIAIERVEGPSPERLKYVYFQRNAGPEEYATESPSLYGHPNARGALTTSASIYETAPAFSGTPPRVNTFAAVGGVPVVFDEVGTRLARLEVRTKPELTGPDGGNTTFFGGQTDDGDDFPNFFGTSAAAPHVAALGALVKAARPAYAPDDVTDVLQASAVDITQYTNDEPVPVGFDAVSGVGLVQADRLTLTPVEVRDLRASLQSSGATVTWEQVETGIATYVLEQSYFGGTYEPVATVTGIGPGDYSVTTDVPEPGIYDYRLSWTRTDGTTDAGLRTRARRGIEGDVRITGPYPNPSSGAFTLEVTVQRRQGVIVVAYDVLGRQLGVLFRDFVNADRPRFIRFDDADVRRFGSGRYFLRVIGEDFDETVPVTWVR